jgi:putative SOS response-associated peptidase YedK
MCGRYTMTVDKRIIERHFGARFVSGHFEPTYNAAPSQMLPIIRTYHPDRIELAKWGFMREDWKNSRMRPQYNPAPSKIRDARCPTFVRCRTQFPSSQVQDFACQLL